MIKRITTRRFPTLALWAIGNVLFAATAHAQFLDQDPLPADAVCQPGDTKLAENTMKSVYWKSVATFLAKNRYSSPILKDWEEGEQKALGGTYELPLLDWTDGNVPYGFYPYPSEDEKSSGAIYVTTGPGGAYIKFKRDKLAPGGTHWADYIPKKIDTLIKERKVWNNTTSTDPAFNINSIPFYLSVRFHYHDISLQCGRIATCQNGNWAVTGTEDEPDWYGINFGTPVALDYVPQLNGHFVQSDYAGVFLKALALAEPSLRTLGDFVTNPCVGNTAPADEVVVTKTVRFQIGDLDISYKRLNAQRETLNEKLEASGKAIERLYKVLYGDLANSKNALDRVYVAQAMVKSLQTQRQGAAAALTNAGRDLQTPAYKKLQRQATQIEGQIGRYFEQIEAARAALAKERATAPGGRKQQDLGKFLGGLVLSIERNEKKLTAVEKKIAGMDAALGIKTARAKQEKENTALEDRYWKARRDVLSLRAQYNAVKLQEDQTSADIIKAEQKENQLAATFINRNNNGSPFITKISGKGFLAVSAVDPTPFVQQVDRDLPVLAQHLLQLGQSRAQARERVLKASETAQEASRRLAVAGYKSMGAQAFIEFLDYADDIYDGFRMGGYAFAASRGVQRLIESAVLGPPSYYDYQGARPPSVLQSMDSKSERLGKSGLTVFMDAALADFLRQRDLTTLDAMRRSYTTPQTLIDTQRKLALRSSARANRVLQGLGKTLSKRVIKDLAKNAATTYAKMKAAELIEGPAFEAVVNADARMAIAVQDLRRTSNMYFETRKLYEKLRSTRKTLVAGYSFSSQMRIKENQTYTLSSKGPGYKILIKDGRNKAEAADLQVFIVGVKADQPDPKKLEFVLPGKALSDMKIKAGKVTVFIDVRQ
jgi:hypothetical protein